MKIKVEVKDEFSCTLERAFNSAILGDATRFLNGYFLQPPVVGFEDDETWGEPGGVRYPITNGNSFTPKGRLFTDKIIEKQKNKIWKWMIFDFKVPLMFFAEKAIGEWEVTPLLNNKIAVRYCYSYDSKNWFFHLFTIAFVNLQWKGMMKKAIIGIKKQAESNEPFIYNNKK